MQTNSTTNSYPLQGWTSSPDGRGSFGILWSCVVCIGLSTWSAICLNVPNPTDTIWTRLKRKCWITFIAVMGPEYLLGFALGEWQSARQSVAEFRKLRQDDRWTIRHAFFADMGGFSLRTNDNIQFFLNTKHILWLVKHKVISSNEFEDKFLLDIKTIDDRNKSNSFIRVVAVFQAIWFCINLIARGAQHLSVTTLEITTVGMIIDSVILYYIWKDKPADIELTEIINTHLNLETILSLEEDSAARTRPYLRSPLGFASHDVSTFNLIYHYLMNIIKGIYPKYWITTLEKSHGRRSDNDVLPLNGVAMVIGVLATIVFLSINFIPWNFTFPTSTERLLWRVSSCGLVGIFIPLIFYTDIFFGKDRIHQMQLTVRAHRAKLQELLDSNANKVSWKSWLIYKAHVFAMKLRNNSPMNDPDLDVSLHFLLMGVPIFAIYSLFRVYLLVEDIIAFRAISADAFDTVKWMAFIPHME